MSKKTAARWMGTLLAGALLAGCASPRYIGSIGRNDVYSNRGYGVLVRLSQDGLLTRWTAIDPSDLDGVPLDARPQRVRVPLDIDGDGLLSVTETTVHYRPTLRLISKTSSVARMDLDVQILGANNKSFPLDAMIALDLKRMAGSSTAAAARAFASIERKTLAGGVPARVAEVDTRGSDGARQVRLLVADVPEFITEEGMTRRHIIRLTLTSPVLSPTEREDFDRLSQALTLAPKGAQPGVKETW